MLRKAKSPDQWKQGGESTDRALDVETEVEVIDWDQPRAAQRPPHFSESPFPPAGKKKMAIMSPSEAFARKKGGDLGKHQSCVWL